MTRRGRGGESGRRGDEDNKDQTSSDSGEARQSAAEQREALKLAAMRAEGEKREAVAKTSIEAANTAARREAGGEVGQMDFLLAGEKQIGGAAVVAIKDKNGKFESITKILSLSPEKAAQLSFVYGENFRVTLKKETIGSAEVDTATVVIPMELNKGELPFLVREVVRAVGALETHTVQKEVGGGGKGKKGKKTIPVEEQTVQAKLLREAVEKQKKLEDGWQEIQKDFAEGVPFRKIREKYKKLETGHSAAWCTAEGILDRLMEDEERKIKEATGASVYEDYGSAYEFQKERLRRTMEQQNGLIYPYDEKRENLLMLGRPSEHSEKIQYLTFLSLLGPHYYRLATKRKGWDIPLHKRVTPILRDSTTVTDYLLRRKLRGFGSPGGAVSLSEKMSGGGVDMSKTFGLAAVEFVGGAAILGLAIGIEMPLRMAGAGFNWLDQTLYGWQKKLGGMASKSYKPWLKSLSERGEEEEKNFDRLVKKALGQQEK